MSTTQEIASTTAVDGNPVADFKVRAGRRLGTSPRGGGAGQALARS